jgi:hypothetical protein
MTPAKTRRLSGATVAVLLLIAATACGGGASPSETIGPPTDSPASPQPSTNAELLIIAPRAGQVLAAADVELRLRLIGGTLADTATTELPPDEGHIHVLVNDKLIAMTSGLELQVPPDQLRVGTNTIQAEFVANNHLPFAPPRVIADVIFEVRG